MKKLASYITTKNMMIVAAAGIGLYLGNKILNGGSLFSFNATSYDTTTVTSTVTADTLKNQILDTIYRSVMNPSVLLQNIEAVKSEVNNYTTQLTNLATENAAGRIPPSTITFYVNKIAQEIAQKLNIELRPSGWGGYYGGSDGGTGYGQGGMGGWPGQGNHYGWRNGRGGNKGGLYDDYGDLYSQYLRYYMMMSMANPYSGGNFYNYPQQPNYGYSQGYGYQSPNMQQYYPTQNYNYYPQNTPYYGGAGGYPNYGGYY